jgi:hypothetical protein
MGRRTYEVLRRKAARWLRQRQSVVLDLTYGQPSERAAVLQLAQRSGARLVVIVPGLVLIPSSDAGRPGALTPDSRPRSLRQRQRRVKSAAN